MVIRNDEAIPLSDAFKELECNGTASELKLLMAFQRLFQHCCVRAKRPDLSVRFEKTLNFIGWPKTQESAYCKRRYPF